MNTTVLMSSARYFRTDLPINPYYTDESVDATAAEAEHQRLRQAIEAAGVTVRSVEAPDNSQDGVYTANWALVRGDRAVLARLPSARNAEEAWAKQQLEKLGINVITVPEKWHFSGQGDALPCGNYLFCGQGYRSDVRAQAFAAETLGYTRIQLQTVPLLDSSGSAVINAASGWPDSFFYDIDLALSVIREPATNQKGIFAYCPAAFTPESIATLMSLKNEFELIPVSENEATSAFACNLLSTGSTVIMSENAPELRMNIESHGLTVVTPSVVELAKGGGFIRCQTLSFND